jgi:hypothetical protein
MPGNRRASSRRAAGPAPRSCPILVLLLLSACAEPRDRSRPGGVHPAGWSDQESPAFHGAFLREHAYPLADCRVCHGEDYAGGAVGSSCLDCHEDGPEACGTCHGEGTLPLPPTGAHVTHEAYCERCHVVPAEVDASGHLGADGRAEVVLEGWDEATARCDTACHVGRSPEWTDETPLGCDGCHGEPPSTHVRFARVAGTGMCGTCHPAPPSATHVDGVLDLAVPGCGACHGGSDGAPPPGLDGAVASSAPSVGAHVRHLDPDLPDRIGRVVECVTCHPVPTDVGDAEHLDETVPSDVLVAFDTVSGTCVSSCHFDLDPGPSWTDDSGAARACDACHGMPPTVTRDGRPHFASGSDLSDCELCHVFDPETHVNGELD